MKKSSSLAAIASVLLGGATYAGEWDGPGQAKIGPNYIPFLQGGAGALVLSMQNKARQLVWIKDFGAVCDGKTDDTKSIQSAWNYAASVNKNLYLSGVGTGACLISSISMPAAPVTGAQSVLIGDGKSSVTLLSTVTGTDCAVTYSATYAVNSDLREVTRGWGVKQNSGSLTGFGVCITGVSNLTVNDIQVQGFTIGLNAVDVIRFNLGYSYFTNNQDHIEGTIGTGSNPNMWNINDNQFSFSAQYAILLTQPGVVNIYGNDFENNGQTLGLVPATIYINGNPVNGKKGVTVWGNYFEGNAGAADIFLTQNSGSTDGVHAIRDNTFGRNTSNLTNEIFVSNNGTGKSYVSIDANALWAFGGYTPSSSRQLVDVFSPTSYTTYSLECSNNQVDNASTEMTHIPCQSPSLGATASNGWTNIGGTYFEWGQATVAIAGTAITLPVPCPNALIQAQVTATNGSTTASLSVGSITTSGFTAYSSTLTGASWTAICH